MHGMSGVEVLKELKEIDEGIEVIMLTAYETLETARQALRLGARGSDDAVAQLVERTI